MFAKHPYIYIYIYIHIYMYMYAHMCMINYDHQKNVDGVFLGHKNQNDRFDPKNDCDYAGPKIDESLLK